MLLADILLEVRDFPLYHGTKVDASAAALRDNRLEANTTHARHTLDVQKAPPGFNDAQLQATGVKGVSLTRSRDIAVGFGPVIFELDQRKLRYDRRVVPIDYWAAENPRSKSLTMRHPSLSTVINADRYEFEEFCIGAIKPLSRYLKTIYMTDKAAKQIQRYKSMAGHWDYGITSREIDALLDHPLLEHLTG